MAYTTIDDPSEYFTTLLYTGNATDNRNLTNDANAGDFQPDWIWLKERSSTSSHQLMDSTRGSTPAVFSDSYSLEDDDANRLQAFQSNGFQVGTASTVNQDGITMVAWQWKCNGGTTSTNDASSTGVGSIDSVIQVNTDAGFSIVTYTGTGSNGTVAHGLGAAPDLVLVKNRSANDHWASHWQSTLGNTNSLRLNTTIAYTDSNGAGYWNDTSATSTTVSVGSRVETNQSNKNYIMYCFKNIQGYSKIGSYVGNGTGANSAADGPFVYTGFKPAWVMAKSSTVTQGWNIFDNKRTPTNEMGAFLQADDSGAETTGYDSMDFLSNGFKLRKNLNGANDSGQTYVYMAFAESPFVSSNGVPTTAR